MSDKDMTPEQFASWIRDNRLATAEACLARYRAALEDIACWSDGDVVTGKFDEPGSAQVARTALAMSWIGPCVHGRDPADRCDEGCDDVPVEVALARARGAK